MFYSRSKFCYGAQTAILTNIVQMNEKMWQVENNFINKIKNYTFPQQFNCRI